MSQLNSCALPIVYSCGCLHSTPPAIIRQRIERNGAQLRFKSLTLAFQSFCRYLVFHWLGCRVQGLECSAYHHGRMIEVKLTLSEGV